MKIVLAAFEVLVASSLAAAHVYSVPEGERIYGGYAVSVDGAKAPVSEVRCSAMPFNRRWPGHQRQIEQTELCGMVRFALDGKATVSVTAARDFREVKIRPLSRNVAFRREGRTVTFDLVKPGGYSVEFDGYHHNLHVFADSAKSCAPPANALVFGPGFHDIGIRELKSGDTVYLDPGAVVYGGFSATGATNIAILGRGILDGGKLKEKILFPASGDGHEAVKNAKRWHTVNFRNCRGVKIDGIVIRDSLLYNIGMWGCEDVAVSGVKIVGQWRFNTDGIDLHNCRRARVSDCFARTFDDTFCFKAHEGYGNCEDCVFERCVAWNDWGKAFEVGVECRAEHLRRLAFRDCDSIHAAGWAMDVTNVDYGRVSDVVFDNIRIESDEPMPAMQLQPADDTPFDPKKGLADPPSLFQGCVRFHHEYSKENGGKWSGGGFIDGVTVRNVGVTTDGRKPMVKFRQIDSGHRPENVVFEDLSVNGKPVESASDILLELPEGMPPPQFKAGAGASVAEALRATLSFRVQSPKGENPTYVFLAEYGSPKEEGTFRVTFNGRRERRICGFYGDVRVYSPPNVLDDELVHHVALDIEPGRKMTLYLDGIAVDSAPVPARGFAAGPLSVAKRDADKPLYWTHFRGRVDDVSLKLEPVAFGPDKVAEVAAPRSRALALPPDPFAKTPTWEKPKTTRRYLHGPFAERMLTFWREGKIVFGEVEHRDDWSLEYKSDVHAHAAWLVHGGRDMPFDFHLAEMRLPPGGEPDHAQAWRVGPLEVELAACAPFGRRPSAHVRLAVRNAGDKPVKEPFAFLLREGLESRLVFGAPDVYRIFNPSLSDWDGIPPDGWRRDGDVFLHGDRFAAFSGAQFDWDAAKGAVRFALSLAPGETKEVEMELGRGARQGFCYADARSRMYADWSAELEKLRIPKAVGANDARIIRNLAVQMLQCLSMPTQGDFVLPRQGGLQRYIWPGDADCFLEALDAIGYGDYVAKAIDFYYSHCQRESGEAGPFKNNWAGDTASVLKTFARHCRVTGDGKCWRRWRDAAFKGFGWIQSTRAAGGGLFPTMKASDHPAVLRAWGSNDLKGLEALEAFAKAAEKFGDPRTGEIVAAARDYRRALSSVMDKWRRAAAGRDEFRVPITAEGDDDALTEAFMFYLHPGRFAEAGLLTADEMVRLRTWLLRRGYANENGLYANQISTKPECRAHVWYTTWSELQWFRAWRRVGRDDLAKEARDACLRFAVTDEFYVGERYHDANPWYYPWSPNASGSGRIVSMIIESASDAVVEWPFIVIRHTGTINSSPEVFERLIDCHRRHRGACDEFWFAAGGRKTPEAVARDCAAFARFRPLCDEVGVVLSYQQGLTLGHGEAHDGKAAPGSQQLSDDAWQRGVGGNIINFLCPRSPDVIAYEREYAKAVLQTANPASYWLDDDLRLGIHKPNGCFCDRCIAAFNAKTGGSWTRESLVERLFSKNEREPVRAAWIDFNADSLAVYAAAVRQAADELKSSCRLAYQSVWADTIYTASSYRPLLEALSGPSHRPVGIRPGAGYYTEAEPCGMVKKCLSVAREAERCRGYGNLVASVCYEQETYPRHVLHKSPGAIMTECALALASGCNSLSLYWYSQSAPEPVEEYDRFLKALSEARPYFERLAASTRRTRLGGVARFVGSAAAETPDYDLRDQVDFDLACAGIPVTVMESGVKTWYVTDKSRREMAEADGTTLAKGAVVDVSDVGKYPLASRRAKLLDDLDAATGGKFPVRIDACRPLRILLRVREDGKLDSVTILNLSIGDTDAFTVRVRRPASREGLILSTKGEARQFHVAPGATNDEGLVEISNLPGWRIMTLFFAES